MRKIMWRDWAILALAIGLLQSYPLWANQAPSSVVNFMQENTLDTEDAGFMSNVSEQDFRSIIQSALTAYAGEANSHGETLVINALWDNTTVNANCSRTDGKVTINMYGGLARRSEVTPEAFALVLCHELGHAYGGSPYLRPAMEIAAEGQADYYGMKVCMQRLLAGIPYEANELIADEFISGHCDGTANASLCTRQLIAGQSIAHLFSSLKSTDLPSYETPDTSVVEVTQLSYPRTIQCRIDTYKNAALGLDRPACWFKN